MDNRSSCEDSEGSEMQKLPVRGTVEENAGQLLQPQLGQKMIPKVKSCSLCFANCCVKKKKKKMFFFLKKYWLFFCLNKAQVSKKQMFMQRHPEKNTVEDQKGVEVEFGKVFSIGRWFTLLLTCCSVILQTCEESPYEIGTMHLLYCVAKWYKMNDRWSDMNPLSVCESTRFGLSRYTTSHRTATTQPNPTGPPQWNTIFLFHLPETNSKSHPLSMLCHANTRVS